MATQQINPGLAMSTDEVIRQHMEALKRFRKEMRDNPAQAKAFLIGAGILEKSGKRLAKRYR